MFSIFNTLFVHIDSFKLLIFVTAVILLTSAYRIAFTLADI